MKHNKSFRSLTHHIFAVMSFNINLCRTAKLCLSLTGWTETSSGTKPRPHPAPIGWSLQVFLQLFHTERATLCYYCCYTFIIANGEAHLRLFLFVLLVTSSVLRDTGTFIISYNSLPGIGYPWLGLYESDVLSTESTATAFRSSTRLNPMYPKQIKK